MPIAENFCSALSQVENGVEASMRFWCSDVLRENPAGPKFCACVMVILPCTKHRGLFTRAHFNAKVHINCFQGWDWAHCDVQLPHHHDLGATSCFIVNVQQLKAFSSVRRLISRTASLLRHRHRSHWQTKWNTNENDNFKNNHLEFQKHMAIDERFFVQVRFDKITVSNSQFCLNKVLHRNWLVSNFLCSISSSRYLTPRWPQHVARWECLSNWRNVLVLKSQSQRLKQKQIGRKQCSLRFEEKSTPLPISDFCTIILQTYRVVTFACGWYFGNTQQGKQHRFHSHQPVEAFFDTKFGCFYLLFRGAVHETNAKNHGKFWHDKTSRRRWNVKVFCTCIHGQSRSILRHYWGGSNWWAVNLLCIPAPTWVGCGIVMFLAVAYGATPAPLLGRGAEW